MPFAYAMQGLNDGDAVKRQGWAGYVKKTVTNAETGAYKITFVKRDGTETEYAVAANGTITASSPITLDVDLMAAMLSDDWIKGTAAAFEAARSGTGTW